MHLAVHRQDDEDLSQGHSLEKPRNALGRAGIWAGAAYTAYLGLALVLQRIAHAASIGFGSYPDEAAHYLSGLMIRDYLLSGLKLSPIDYVSDYYLHLSMIGIGHWPPVFYVAQAAWMLVFGYTRADVLIFIAATTALTSLTVCLATRDQLQWPAALIMGGIVQATAIILWSDCVVMTDIFTAMVILWAALSLGRFLNTEKTGHAIQFGLLASLALLTKPSAVCLALLPLPAIFLVRKPRLLRRPALWASALVVVAICAPWYLATRHFESYGVIGGPILENLVLVVIGSIITVCRQLNVILVPFAISVYLFFRQPVRDGIRAVLILLPIATIIILGLARVGLESRYLIPALLPIIIVSADGVAWFSGFLKKYVSSPAWRAGLVAGVLALAFLLIRPVNHQLIASGRGLDGMLAIIRAKSADAPIMLMVAGRSGASDGRIIATLAEGMPNRPRDIVLRATKIFADTDWNGTHYVCEISRPQQVVKELDDDGVSLLAIDNSPRWGNGKPHQQLLMEAIVEFPGRFTRIYYDEASGYSLFAFAPKNLPTIPRKMLNELKRKRDLNPLSRIQDSDSAD